MSIKINGKVRDLSCSLTLTALLEREKSPAEGLVVMINDVIIPRETWDTTKIRGNDEIEIMCFVSGG